MLVKDRRTSHTVLSVNVRQYAMPNKINPCVYVNVYRTYPGPFPFRATDRDEGEGWQNRVKG